MDESTAKPAPVAVPEGLRDALTEHRYLCGSGRGVHPRWEECACGRRFSSTVDTPAWKAFASHQAAESARALAPRPEPVVAPLSSEAVRALRAAANEMEAVIADGDAAEVAAPVPGEVGRSTVVGRRDALYEEPHTWLREYADRLVPEDDERAEVWNKAMTAIHDAPDFSFKHAVDRENAVLFLDRAREADMARRNQFADTDQRTDP